MDGNEKIKENFFNCPFCGGQIIEGRSICPDCGKNIVVNSLSKHENEFNAAVADYFEMSSRERGITNKEKYKNNKVSFFNAEDMSKVFGILCLVLGAVLTLLFGIIGSAVSLVLGVLSIVLGINAKKKDGSSIMVALTTSVIGLILSGVLVTSCVAFGKYSFGIGLFGVIGGSCISQEIIKMFK